MISHGITAFAVGMLFFLPDAVLLLVPRVGKQPFQYKI